jgi:hypothetical protein
MGKVGCSWIGRSSHFSFKEGDLISSRLTNILCLLHPLTNLYQIHQISEVGTLWNHATQANTKVLVYLHLGVIASEPNPVLFGR